MSDAPHTRARLPRPRLMSPFLWWVLALVVTLSVAAINGGPLYYFDSGGYLDNGIKALGQLGLWQPEVTQTGASTGTGGADDGTVNGSRSLLYSVLSAGISVFLGTSMMPFFHSILLLVSVFVFFRILTREVSGLPQVSTMSGLAIVAAGAGSLPFYVAYLMPDIFAGILILLAAVMIAVPSRLTVVETLFLLVVGVAAVLAHPSHLLLVGGLVFVALLVGLLARQPGWWRAVALLAAMAGGGVAERAAFTAVADKALDAEVIYYPFLTARLIQDGVGYDQLNAVCPNDENPTCALHAALSLSDDPMRLTASHIIFETAPGLGSFRLLSAEDQQKVADAQVAFAVETLLDRPMGVVGAIVKNTFSQLGMNSIWMTVPDLNVVRGLQQIQNIPDGLIQDGRLTIVDRGWIDTLDRIHTGYYLATFAAAFIMLLWPGLLPKEIRLIAVVVALGLLGNAFICGAISQPADRYGARVIWLVPFVAAIMFGYVFNRRNRAAG